MRLNGGRGATLPLVPALGASRLRVEAVPLMSFAAHRADWEALRDRALEGNVFLEPAFLLSLFATDGAAGRWRMLAVWSAAEAGWRLVGLLPVRLPHVRGFLAHGLSHPMLTCGTPLLDRDEAPEAFAAMLRWLAGSPLRPQALSLAGIAADGGFARMLAGETGLPVTVVAERARAVLRHAGGNVLSLASAKTRKERKRQRRRLSEQGERAYSSAIAPDAVRRATERFLLLERRGWKGARGTALLDDGRHAAFARAMTAAMAAEGKCRIDALEIDGQAIAMGIILTSHGHAHFWKTAFDEDLAPLSPGVQFAIDLAERQLQEDVALTDSCAVPDHPMIDRLWPDRLTIVDLVVAVGARRTARYAATVASERLRRRVAGFLKLQAKRLRRGRP